MQGIPRLEYLAEASRLTSGLRDKEYGPPYNNFSNCALLWSAYLHGKYGGLTIDPLQFNLTAEDVAWFNVLQKMSRTFSGSAKADTYIDAACYAAIAGECAKEESQQ